MNEDIIPFGMFFREIVPESEKESILPEYDPKEGISFVYDSEGKRTNYVDWSHKFLATKTGDSTKAVTDSSDTDPYDDQ